MINPLSPLRSTSISPSRRRPSPLPADSQADSPRTYSFGHSARFRSVQRNAHTLQLDLPSTLTGRTTSFGYGTRWTPRNPMGSDSPPPGSYAVGRELGERHGGFSFGERRWESRKRESPGPGSYRVNGEPGREAPKFTMRSKGKGVYYPSSPPPNAYRPSTSLIQSAPFQTISFGLGRRVAFHNKAVADFPGPGAYNTRQLFRDPAARRFLRVNRASVPGDSVPAV